MEFGLNEESECKVCPAKSIRKRMGFDVGWGVGPYILYIHNGWSCRSCHTPGAVEHRVKLTIPGLTIVHTEHNIRHSKISSHN